MNIKFFCIVNWLCLIYCNNSLSNLRNTLSKIEGKLSGHNECSNLKVCPFDYMKAKSSSNYPKAIVLRSCCHTSYNITYQIITVGIKPHTCRISCVSWIWSWVVCCRNRCRLHMMHIFHTYTPSLARSTLHNYPTCLGQLERLN